MTYDYSRRAAAPKLKDRGWTIENGGRALPLEAASAAAAMESLRTKKPIKVSPSGNDAVHKDYPYTVTVKENR